MFLGDAGATRSKSPYFETHRLYKEPNVRDSNPEELNTITKTITGTNHPPKSMPVPSQVNAIRISEAYYSKLLF